MQCDMLYAPPDNRWTLIARLHSLRLPLAPGGKGLVRDAGGARKLRPG